MAYHEIFDLYSLLFLIFRALQKNYKKKNSVLSPAFDPLTSVGSYASILRSKDRSQERIYNRMKEKFEKRLKRGNFSQPKRRGSVLKERKKSDEIVDYNEVLNEQILNINPLNTISKEDENYNPKLSRCDSRESIDKPYSLSKPIYYPTQPILDLNQPNFQLPRLKNPSLIPRSFTKTEKKAETMPFPSKGACSPNSKSHILSRKQILKALHKSHLKSVSLRTILTPKQIQSIKITPTANNPSKDKSKSPKKQQKRKIIPVNLIEKSGALGSLASRKNHSMVKNNSLKKIKVGSKERISKKTLPEIASGNKKIVSLRDFEGKNSFRFRDFEKEKSARARKELKSQKKMPINLFFNQVSKVKLYNKKNHTIKRKREKPNMVNVSIPNQQEMAKILDKSQERQNFLKKTHVSVGTILEYGKLS
ncbi:unnamed protein product [Moneuplotes crassus]|uniref:Uncharacterized protein n=1 Tax=Euplotes crassus TaxID=5936 RepID=A0AAD1XD29_EUPCR|nr:unnamed protein product [Moneuplotes crassus]